MTGETMTVGTEEIRAGDAVSSEGAGASSVITGSADEFESADATQTNDVETEAEVATIGEENRPKAADLDIQIGDAGETANGTPQEATESMAEEGTPEETPSENQIGDKVESHEVIPVALNAEEVPSTSEVISVVVSTAPLIVEEAPLVTEVTSAVPLDAEEVPSSSGPEITPLEPTAPPEESEPRANEEDPAVAIEERQNFVSDLMGGEAEAFTDNPDQRPEEEVVEAPKTTAAAPEQTQSGKTMIEAIDLRKTQPPSETSPFEKETTELETLTEDTNAARLIDEEAPSNNTEEMEDLSSEPALAGDRAATLPPDVIINENTRVTTASIHDITHVEDIEDIPDSEVVSLAETPKPVSKATNHRAFQSVIDENVSLKGDLKRKEDELESIKTRNKALRSELVIAKGKVADVDIYSKKLEIALSENLKLKSTQNAAPRDIDNAYNEMETAFLTKKYQEGKVVEEALRNQISLNATVKDEDDRTIESLTRRVKRLDKELRAKDDRLTRKEVELADVTKIVGEFEEFLDPNVYRQVVEKAKGKTPLNGEKRVKSDKKNAEQIDGDTANATKNKSKICMIQ